MIDFINYCRNLISTLFFTIGFLISLLSLEIGFIIIIAGILVYP